MPGRTKIVLLMLALLAAVTYEWFRGFPRFYAGRFVQARTSFGGEWLLPIPLLSDRHREYGYWKDGQWVQHGPAWMRGRNSRADRWFLDGREERISTSLNIMGTTRFLQKDRYVDGVQMGHATFVDDKLTEMDERVFHGERQYAHRVADDKGCRLQAYPEDEQYTIERLGVKRRGVRLPQVGEPSTLAPGWCE